MTTYFIAAMMLSVAAYLHTVSGKLGLRLANPVAEVLWRLVSITALGVWAVMILRGFMFRHWSEPTAALLASFGMNWWFGHRGPKPGWPLVSLIFALVGLGLAGWSYINE